MNVADKTSYRVLQALAVCVRKIDEICSKDIGITAEDDYALTRAYREMNGIIEDADYELDDNYRLVKVKP